MPARKGGGMGWVRVEIIDQGNTGSLNGLEAIDRAHCDVVGEATG